jgi:hypothetical protein
MKKSTHMKKDELQFAKEIHDAYKVALEEAMFLDTQLKVKRGNIEWAMQEDDLLTRAKKYLTSKGRSKSNDK